MNICVGALSLMIGLPLIDALPPRLLPTRMRTSVFGFIAARYLFEYVNNLRQTAEIHAKQNVWVLRVDGYVELSSFDVWMKSFAATSMLAAHTCYRSIRYPTRGVLIEKPVLLSELHGIRPGLQFTQHQEPALLWDR